MSWFKSFSALEVTKDLLWPLIWVTKSKLKLSLLFSCSIFSNCHKIDGAACLLNKPNKRPQAFHTQPAEQSTRFKWSENTHWDCTVSMHACLYLLKWIFCLYTTDWFFFKILMRWAESLLYTAVTLQTILNYHSHVIVAGLCTIQNWIQNAF